MSRTTGNSPSLVLACVALGALALAGCGETAAEGGAGGAGGGSTTSGQPAASGSTTESSTTGTSGSTTTGTPSTCSDGVQNGDETDVDCGGGSCPACTIGSACARASDCTTGFCNDQVCEATPSCGAAFPTGDWQLLTASVAAGLDPAADKQYLYLGPEYRWYLSPVTALSWDWATFQEQTGSYAYCDGSAQSAFDCSGGEAGHFGVGCSNGGGNFLKVLPYGVSNPEAGTVRICQDQPNAYGGSACEDDVEIYVRELGGAGPVCGNAQCEPPDETQANCCTDCGCPGGQSCQNGACVTDPSCGDGSCNGSETQSNCCTDCGCPGGQSCQGGTCVADPYCGDGSCNGGETQGSCCIDCGCPGGQSCQGGTCVVNPYCGDGSCNGGESQGSCCTDCGCGSGYSCQANSCVCAQSFLHMENVMSDMQQFCFATNSWYTQQSTAYININNTGWIYMPDGGYVDWSGSIGSTATVTEQCCLIDVCGGNQTCPTPNGNYPCFCASPTVSSYTISQCGQTFVPVCN